VQGAVPAHPARRHRGAGREAVERVGDEDAGPHQRGAEDTHQPRCPGGRLAATQRSPHPHRASEEQQAADDEVRDLNPAEVTEREQAQWVPGEVEPLPGKHLPGSDNQIERSGGDTARQQPARPSHLLGCGGTPGEHLDHLDSSSLTESGVSAPVGEGGRCRCRRMTMTFVIDRR
jgi:hypothetical protein